MFIIGLVMSPTPVQSKDALLSDLDKSIEKALDAKMSDLAGALYRLQGSAKGWCDQEDCGGCPLAPNTCVSGIEERVKELIEQHHLKKRVNNSASDSARKSLLSQKSTKFKKHRRAIVPVGRYFTHLSQILNEQGFGLTRDRLEKQSQGHKLRWQRVNETFQHLSPRTKKVHTTQHR